MDDSSQQGSDQAGADKGAAPEADLPDAPATGFPEPPGRDPEDRSDPDPHHALNIPVGEPDPTEWPDPYDRRPDPRDPIGSGPTPFGDAPHTTPGAESTSEPHPDQDPEAIPRVDRERDNLDQ